MAGKQLFDNSNHAILEREEGSVGLSQSENLWEKVTKRPEKTRFQKPENWVRIEF